MDFKKRIIEELEMTDIQADTLYKGYVQVVEKLAKEYHTEQLRIGVVVGTFFCGVEGGVCPYETKDSCCKAEFSCENKVAK